MRGTGSAPTTRLSLRREMSRPDMATVPSEPRPVSAYRQVGRLISAIRSSNPAARSRIERRARPCAAQIAANRRTRGNLAFQSAAGDCRSLEHDIELWVRARLRRRGGAIAAKAGPSARRPRRVWHPARRGTEVESAASRHEWRRTRTAADRDRPACQGSRDRPHEAAGQPSLSLFKLARRGRRNAADPFFGRAPELHRQSARSRAE